MIVVTTPTGQIGSQVLEKILDGGEEPVRVVARDPSRLSAHVRERVEVVRGSHDDPEVVNEAFEGADCVLWVVVAPPTSRADSIEDHYLKFTRPASEAITSRSVGRVVGVSSLGRGFGKNAGNLSAAFAMDGLIEGTGVGYRALRMPFFMENLLGQAEAIKSQGVYRLANSADRPLATVATRDIAMVAAGLLLDGSWSGQEGVPVFGDELFPNEMARVMSEVLGQPVRFQEVPPADFKATLTERGGMSGPRAQGMVDMVAAQNEGIYDAEASTAQRSPTSFRQWCEEVLKPAVIA